MLNDRTYTFIFSKISSKNRYGKFFEGTQAFYRETSNCAEKDGLRKRVLEACYLDRLFWKGKWFLGWPIILFGIVLLRLEFWGIGFGRIVLTIYWFRTIQLVDIKLLHEVVVSDYQDRSKEPRELILLGIT